MIYNGINAEKKEVNNAAFWLFVSFFTMRYIINIKEDANRLGIILATRVNGRNKLKKAKR